MPGSFMSKRFPAESITFFESGFRRGSLFHRCSLSGRTLGRLARTLGLELFCTAAILVNPDCDVANYPVTHAHAAFQLGNLAARSRDLQQDIGAFILAANRVSQLTFAHDFGFHNCATLISDDALITFAQLCDLIVRGIRVDDEHYFVNSICCQNYLLWNLGSEYRESHYANYLFVVYYSRSLVVQRHC